MPDETRPDTIPDLIIKLLYNITDRYRRIDIYDDGSESLSDVDDETVWVHDNWRYARAEALSIGEIDDLNALLLQMQNSTLPALQQQLGEMLESLNLDDLPARVPNPNLFYAPEIVFRLGHTVDQINHFVQSIAPIVVNPLHIPQKSDHDYGGLKVYRSTDLIEKLNDLMRQNVIQALLHHHVLFIRACSNNHRTSSYDESQLKFHSKNLAQATAQTSEAIDRLIKWSKKSDFGLIQADCQSFANDLDPILENLFTRIISKVTPEQRRKSINAGHTNQSQAGPENERQDTGSDIDSSDAQHNQPSASRLTDSFDDTSLSLHLMRLTEATIPLIKILRIFFKKLSDTPISKAPFTISAQLCSDQINPMDYELGSLDCGIENLLNVIYQLDDGPIDMAQVKYLETLHEELYRHFNSSLTLLCFHLIPLSETQYHLPRSVNLCKTWFFTLREQFCLASDMFVEALYQMKIAIQM
ncbi:uncharacterized protein PGTG_04159 [Puccinia graminis f. sp. tritici CRL 75-36-700-3]|uniref:Uncharacterized protein n=1 Tax=Puccinia graminis f. sp. tritici (strain CRL 75-36-700-3 / race SCCL) TaxID=418459 RepID=E3K1M8_PUCGT|nr:uncharacterized protein PGTG_04159 [Puccinia graminis f. sp. tritici CRL 75-36-700-3]EFP78203.2 hypothetical protein PGTG_04159 [Puccinia graminis f. sp. tritici CRL 75-36-700-3]